MKEAAFWNAIEPYLEEDGFISIADLQHALDLPEKEAEEAARSYCEMFKLARLETRDSWGYIRRDPAEPVISYARCGGTLPKKRSHQVKTVRIMIGIQGSGKSEFCRRYLPRIERVNLDTLKTRNNEARRIADCHAHGVDYVVDNTNPTREDRARYIPAAKAQGYRVIGYFMQSRLQDCIARNNRREGKEVVPPKAIAMTSNRLEMPSMAEGFDALYFVANDGEEMTISEWREDE